MNCKERIKKLFESKKWHLFLPPPRVVLNNAVFSEMPLAKLCRQVSVQLGDSQLVLTLKPT